MYVDIIDKVTKCHFLWNGDQCKVLLKTKGGKTGAVANCEPRRSVACLSETRRCLGWKKKKKKSLTINAAKPYSGLEAGQSGSMNEWVRNPNPGKDVVSGVFDLPHQTHQLDLNFMLTEPNKSVLGSLGTPVWENDLVKKEEINCVNMKMEDESDD